MTKKMITSERDLEKLDAFEDLVSQLQEEKAQDKVAKTTNCQPPRQEKSRSCKVKLPVLKLEDLVAEVTEYNAHEEVSTGPTVGNEILL